ncbi:MAG: hypothetical protein ACK4K7_07560 [Allosphingosinicella sp.]|uniref:hypothetical protein n=1 Tax=Allosphingosinicella sp. TaxID=2823234 RepID=UPI0039598D96
MDANLKVTCRVCGRTGVFPTRDIVAYFRARSWNSAWTAAGERFRCDGIGAEGCGARGAHLSLVPIARAPAMEPPRPTARDLRAEADRRR